MCHYILSIYPCGDSYINRSTLCRNGPHCTSFEVVSHQRSPIDCFLCRRSPRRRKLPARARGIFAPSWGMGRQLQLGGLYWGVMIWCCDVCRRVSGEFLVVSSAFIIRLSSVSYRSGYRIPMTATVLVRFLIAVFFLKLVHIVDEPSYYIFEIDQEQHLYSSLLFSGNNTPVLVLVSNWVKVFLRFPNINTCRKLDYTLRRVFTIYNLNIQ